MLTLRYTPRFGFCSDQPAILITVDADEHLAVALDTARWVIEIVSYEPKRAKA